LFIHQTENKTLHKKLLNLRKNKGLITAENKMDKVTPASLVRE
jgi:hypothetical protein